MTTLKELTQENHRRAERHAFVSAMMKNQLTPTQWADYLEWKRNILIVLDAKLGLGELHSEFDRTKHFDADIESTKIQPRVLEATGNYISHILESNEIDAWAHVYVHYLGDLRGGQMLKKIVQLPMHHVDYLDAAGIESIIRSNVSDALANEANKGFELTMQAMEEIMS
jgi:heme oxygenase